MSDIIIKFREKVSGNFVRHVHNPYITGFTTIEVISMRGSSDLSSPLNDNAKDRYVMWEIKNFP
jgi:hypothetical protein